MSHIIANNTNYLFNIQTVQAGAFRVLVEALKDILTDCNFIIDETGIKLIATDSSHNVLIHMKLFLKPKRAKTITFCGFGPVRISPRRQVLVSRVVFYCIFFRLCLSCFISKFMTFEQSWLCYVD